MIPDSLAPGIVIRAPDKTSARESGDEANLGGYQVNYVQFEVCLLSKFCCKHGA